MPFTCNNTFYVSQSASASSATTLYTINTSANPFTFTAVGDNSHGYVYNAMGFKTGDGFIYAMRYDASVGAKVNNQLLKISSDEKVYNLGVISGLSGSVTYGAGAFDSAGNYYIRSTNSSLMYKIDVSTRTLLSTINLVNSSSASVTVNTGDLAYNTSDSMFYGVDSITSKLVKINPSTGLVTYGTGTANSSQYGAMWGSGSGHIYGSANDGSEFAQFNLTSGTSTKISNVLATTLSDGATCIGVTAVLALATDLEISKTDGVSNYVPGANTTYTIVVTNNGPFGVVDANVVDALTSGITPMSYYAVASSGSTTNVTGTSASPQTGALNDLVSLPVGGSVTYTVTVAFQSNYTGNLVNIATVTAPSTATENLTSNNSATDTDAGVCYNDASTAAATSVTNHGITLLQRVGANNGNWPMNRNSAHTVLESNTKGFVITRMTTAQISS